MKGTKETELTTQNEEMATAEKAELIAMLRFAKESEVLFAYADDLTVDERHKLRLLLDEATKEHYQRVYSGEGIATPVTPYDYNPSVLLCSDPAGAFIGALLVVNLDQTLDDKWLVYVFYRQDDPKGIMNSIIRSVFMLDANTEPRLGVERWASHELSPEDVWVGVAILRATADALSSLYSSLRTREIEEQVRRGQGRRG